MGNSAPAHLMSIESFCWVSFVPLRRELAARPRSADVPRQATGTSSPILGIARHGIAVVGAAMNGPILQNAGGYRIGRAGRVSKGRVVVVVQALLLHLDFQRQRPIPGRTGEPSSLLTSVSCIQCAGGNSPLASAVAGAPAAPASACGSAAGLGSEASAGAGLTLSCPAVDIWSS